MTTETTEPVSIGDAAEQCGVSIDTLRYYEREGLMLHDVRRTRSGRRVYEEADLRWVVLLTRLRATGMPIRDVRSYAALCRDGGNEDQRRAMLEAHRLRVLAELGRVQDHLAAIDAKIDGYRRPTG